MRNYCRFYQSENLWKANIMKQLDLILIGGGDMDEYCSHLKEVTVWIDI